MGAIGGHGGHVHDPKKGFRLGTWICLTCREHHGKPWKTYENVDMYWMRKTSYPFLTGKMGLFDLWRSCFDPDFTQKNMSRQASTQISGPCYFLSSSFVLSLLGERNDGGWMGQLSLLLRWDCGLWLHPTLEQKPVPGSCISPMAQSYWCFSPSTPIFLVDPWC